MSRSEDGAGRSSSVVDLTSDRALTNPQVSQAAQQEPEQRKHLEASLRESEEKYRQLVETTDTGYVILDVHGQVVDANQRYVLLTGRSHLQQVIGHSVLEWTAPYSVEHNTAEIRRCLEQGFARNLEVDYLSPDGRITPIEINATVIRESGGIRILTLCRDISERRQVEASLRTNETRARETAQLLEGLFNAIPDAIGLQNKQRCIIRYNAAGYRLLGLGPDQAHGKHCYELIGKTKPCDVCATAEVLVTKRPAQVEKFVPELGMHFEARAYPVLAEDGELLYVIEHLRDITAQRRVEEDNARIQAQLLQAQKMESVGRLAGGVAHDFNNMLTAVLGHTELARLSCPPSAQLRAHLDAINDSALRSAELVRQLLAFARKQTAEPKVLDLNDVVIGTLKMLQRMIGEEVVIRWQPAAGLPPVRIDPSQLNQILANLCVNARDAIAGIGTITIETGVAAIEGAPGSAYADLVPGDYVSLSVSDDGSGMDESVLKHLFEPFFTTKEVGKGTGLGLATVYGIVKQNLGGLSVRSAPGKGSTFTVLLPRFVGETDRARPNSPSSTPAGHGEIVLLVEDEPLVLHLGQMMLETLGYRVLIASGPGEALQLARAHAAEITLLISDVIMPEMNGRQLAERLSELIPGLKCLYTSGYTADILPQNGIVDRDLSFIQKPFSLDSLALAVRAALDRDMG